MNRLMEKTVLARIRHGLAFRGLADEPLAVLGERDDRRRRPRAFAVFQNYRVAALHDRHAGVRRPQIDT